MSTTVYHSGTAKAAATDAVVDLLDGGSGSSPALKFYAGGSSITSPGAVAATLVLAGSPAAFGPANGTTGVATCGTINSDTGAAGNASPVDHAGLCDKSGTIIIYCAVAASGADINMSNGTTVAANDTVSCSNLTYQALSQ